MRLLKQFARSESGVSAIEFAFILPVMVIMFLGTVEVSNYVTAARRVAAVTSIAGDLVAQEPVMTDSDLSDVFGALDVVMAPLDPAIMQVTISSVVADADGTTYRVAWSEARNAAPRGAGSVVGGSVFPAGLIVAFQGAIMVEVAYGYDPLFAGFLSRTDLTDTFYFKARRSLKVTRTP